MTRDQKILIEFIQHHDMSMISTAKKGHYAFCIHPDSDGLPLCDNDKCKVSVFCFKTIGKAMVPTVSRAELQEVKSVHPEYFV